MPTSAPIDIEDYLKPISEDEPGGEDLTYDIVMDEVEEARREDDPSLPRGEWTSEIKSADWRLVMKLTGDALVKRSKSMRMASCMTEALGRLHGLAGLAAGFQLIEALVSRFWDHLYPRIEDDDPLERVSRLEWLDRNLPRTLALLPLADPGGKDFGLGQWHEAQELENLARRDLSAAKLEEDEGKTSQEAFMKAVASTPADFYVALFEDLEVCKAAFADFNRATDEKLGRDAPMFGEIRKLLDEIGDLVVRLGGEKGVSLGGDAGPGEGETTDAESPVDAAPAAAGTTRPAMASGQIASRAEALERLREIARFFRATEPHSPTAYLVERAVRWGEMPLERWLNEVIRDETTLSSLKDLLGIAGEPPPE